MDKQEFSQIKMFQVLEKIHQDSSFLKEQMEKEKGLLENLKGTQRLLKIQTWRAEKAFILSTSAQPKKDWGLSALLQRKQRFLNANLVLEKKLSIPIAEQEEVEFLGYFLLFRYLALKYLEQITEHQEKIFNLLFAFFEKGQEKEEKNALQTITRIEFSFSQYFLFVSFLKKMSREFFDQLLNKFEHQCFQNKRKFNQLKIASQNLLSAENFQKSYEALPWISQAFFLQPPFFPYPKRV